MLLPLFPWASSHVSFHSEVYQAFRGSGVDGSVLSFFIRSWFPERLRHCCFWPFPRTGRVAWRLVAVGWRIENWGSRCLCLPHKAHRPDPREPRQPKPVAHNLSFGQRHTCFEFVCNSATGRDTVLCWFGPAEISGLALHRCTRDLPREEGEITVG